MTYLEPLQNERMLDVQGIYFNGRYDEICDNIKLLQNKPSRKMAVQDLRARKTNKFDLTGFKPEYRQGHKGYLRTMIFEGGVFVAFIVAMYFALLTLFAMAGAL